MYEIRIGINEKLLGEITESWVVQHVQERKEHGQPVCVQAILKDSSVDMILSTPQCSTGHGGGRQPNHKEESIFNIWNRWHLNQRDWSVGDLLSFLKQLRSVI